MKLRSDDPRGMVVNRPVGLSLITSTTSLVALPRPIWNVLQLYCNAVLRRNEIVLRMRLRYGIKAIIGQTMGLVHMYKGMKRVSNSQQNYILCRSWHYRCMKTKYWSILHIETVSNKGLLQAIMAWWGWVLVGKSKVLEQLRQQQLNQKQEQRQ